MDTEDFDEGYMSSPKRITKANTKKITIGDDNGLVSVERIIEVLQSTIDLVESIQGTLNIEGANIKWKIVKASMSSPLTFVVAPISRRSDASKVRDTVKATRQQLKQVQSRPEQAATTLGKHRTEIMQRIVAGKNTQETVTYGFDKVKDIKFDKVTSEKLRTSSNEMTIAEENQYTDYGSIEGKLENVITHNGYKLQVYDLFTSHKVDCIISTDKLDQYKDFLTKRVIVSGEITYKDDKPFSMRVTDVTEFEPVSTSESHRNFRAMNIGGGMTPEEYIQDMRDE